LLQSLLGEDRFAGRPEIASARIFLPGKTVSLPVSPRARSIPRFDLDAALLDSAQRAGVRVEQGTTVFQVEATAGGPFRASTKAEIFTAPTFVNATGRWSQLTADRRAAQTRWVGLKAHFREYAPPQSVDLYFFSGGYCGVQPVGENVVNAAAMVGADNAQSMDQVLAANPELWRRSRDWEPLFEAITTFPLYFRTPQAEDRGMLLAGDAAAFIDPFAGDGISLALHSGKLAADSLAGVWRGTLSLEEARRRYCFQYHRRFTRAFRNAARLRKLQASPSWVRSGLLGLLQRPPIAGYVVRGTRARKP
jgi:menaquinone-9 beta-reductase